MKRIGARKSEARLPGRLEGSASNAVHPSAEVLQRFLRGDVSKTEAMAVVRHLLRGCSVCAAIIQKGI